MTQREKILQAEKLFNQIKSLFPSKSIDLSIHAIDLTQLPKGWHVENEITESGIEYGCAKRDLQAIFGITLFGDPVNLEEKTANETIS